MSRLETLISEHRINKAINEVAPMDKAMGIFYGFVFGYLFYNYNLKDLREDSSSGLAIEKERDVLIGKIDEEHPEWHQKAPKKNVIVAFLNGKPQ